MWGNFGKVWKSDYPSKQWVILGPKTLRKWPKFFPRLPHIYKIQILQKKGSKTTTQTWDLSKKFTLLDFWDKNFTPLISPNFKSFGDKTQKQICENGEIYTADKNFTLLTAVLAVTNLSICSKKTMPRIGGHHPEPSLNIIPTKRRVQQCTSPGWSKSSSQTPTQ